MFAVNNNSGNPHPLREECHHQIMLLTELFIVLLSSVGVAGFESLRRPGHDLYVPNVALKMFSAPQVCRGGGIRTHDLYVPNVARYQAALHPE